MHMKKTLILVFIAAFLFPAFGHAAAASTKAAVQTPAVEITDITSPLLQGQTVTAKKVAVQTALSDIYNQLITLATQTQTAINQLNVNGIDTTEAQKEILAANVSLAKAKTDITAFNNLSGKSSIATLKTSAAVAEASLTEAKTNILESLTALKATLPALDAAN